MLDDIWHNVINYKTEKIIKVFKMHLKKKTKESH